VFAGAGDPTGLVGGGSTDVGLGAEDAPFAVGLAGSAGAERGGGGAFELRRAREPLRAGASPDAPWSGGGMEESPIAILASLPAVATRGRLLFLRPDPVRGEKRERSCPHDGQVRVLMGL
jgi:hypothetical protein